MSTIVTSQAELDEAVAASAERIIIDSPPGVWITVGGTTQVAGVRGASWVGPVGDQATVSDVWDQAIVRDVWDQATVRDVRDQATVSDVRDQATVHLNGAATAERIGSHVAVHLHSGQATVSGGVIIDHTAVEDTGEAWCAYHAVEVTDGTATLYKAVRDDWTTGRGPEWTYAPGATVTAEDFEPTRECGAGLHLCSTPAGSRRYLQAATRYVAVEVAVATLVPLDDKAKTSSCTVLYEVSIDGIRVGEAS